MLAAEGFGLFFIPGETALIAASVEAAITGKLNIIIVLAIAFLGAITGDNFAFFIGREYGFRFLCRYGHAIWITDKRIKFMQFLYLSYGKRIVFAFRFVALLRSWESLLAGANAMRWRKFFPTNAIASLLWVCLWGLGAYGLGQTSTSVLVWVSGTILLVFIVCGFFAVRYFRRHEDEMEARSEEALPGPLKAHRPSDLRKGRQGLRGLFSGKNEDGS